MATTLFDMLHLLDTNQFRNQKRTEFYLSFFQKKQLVSFLRPILMYHQQSRESIQEPMLSLLYRTMTLFNSYLVYDATLQELFDLLCAQPVPDLKFRLLECTFIKTYSSVCSVPLPFYDIMKDKLIEMDWSIGDLFYCFVDVLYVNYSMIGFVIKRPGAPIVYFETDLLRQWYDTK